MVYVNYLTKKYSFAVALAIIKSKPSEISVTDYILKVQNQFQNPSCAQDMDIDNMSVDSSDFDDIDYIEDTCAIQSQYCTESIQNQDCTDLVNEAKTCRLDTNETNLKSVNVSFLYSEESQSLLEGHDKKIQLIKPNPNTDTTQFAHEDCIHKGQHYSLNVPNKNHNTGKSQELLGLGDDDIFCETYDTSNLPIRETIQKDTEKEYEVIGCGLESFTLPPLHNFDLNAVKLDLGTSSEVESQSILKNVRNSQHLLTNNINCQKMEQPQHVLQKKTMYHDTHPIRYKNVDEDSDATQMTNIEFNDEYVASIQMDLSLYTSGDEERQHKILDSDTILDTNIDFKKTCLNTHTANKKTQILQSKLNLHKNTNPITNTSEADNVVSNVKSYLQILDSRVIDIRTQNIESEFKNDANLNPNKFIEKFNMHAYNNNENFVKPKVNAQVETDMANTVTQNIHAQNETTIEMLSQAIIGINEDVNGDIVDSSEGGLEIDCSSVPFKVVIELNKVKQNLTTMSGNNIKTQVSGYKSDSQMSFTQNLKPGLQDPSVNQSANCLLIYLTSCSVNCIRQPVTADIADALSKFIDQLYEQDIILPFMDEILPCIDHILDKIFNGKGCGRDEFLSKEENISRLSLLTESVEMTHYTIGKIMSLMESFYPRLGAQTAFEVDNIEDMETICYAFHVLEVLLERYMKNRKSTEIVEDSIEDEPDQELHHSISDIWRKRWDPNFKQASTKSSSRRERSDVVSRSTQLLNKYIVSCMDSYSLVSYAALECYNALHI